MEGESLEHWIEFIQPSTHVAENYCKRYGITDWVQKHYQLKFKLASHIARRTDSRWSNKVLYWRPVDGKRSRGHPHRRWTDDLDAFFAIAHNLGPGDWICLVSDRDR